MRGLARLVEGQRCFADEFGLGYGRVFRDEFDSFKNRRVEEVLRDWLTGGEAGARQLGLLLEDLLQHQLALVGALDGIASEAVRQLSPELVKKATPGVLGIRPWVWRSYRNLHRGFVENPVLRHQKLVLGGFVNGYVRARKKSEKSS